jgi:exonuclease SbcC
LGYDRLSGAQELVRERRRALLAEINGLKQGMPDADAVWRMLAEAEARVAVARTRAVEAMPRGHSLRPSWRRSPRGGGLTRRPNASVRSNSSGELKLAENEALALAPRR